MRRIGWRLRRKYRLRQLAAAKMQEAYKSPAKAVVKKISLATRQAEEYIRRLASVPNKK